MKWKLWNYVILGYQNSELPSINTSHETLCNKSQLSKQSFVSMYLMYSVNIYNVMVMDVWSFTYCIKMIFIDYLCMLFMGDGIKHRPWCVI
jgi:hypothetical protein